MNERLPTEHAASRTCTSCGTTRSDGAKFCPECGAGAAPTDTASRRYQQTEPELGQNLATLEARRATLAEAIERYGQLGWRVGTQLETRAELIGKRNWRRYLEIDMSGALQDQLFKGSTRVASASAISSTSAVQSTSAVPPKERNVPAAVFVAILMAMPAAILLGLMLGLVIVRGTAGWTVMAWTFLIGFLSFSFLFARGDLHPRSSFLRGLITVSVESLVLPLVALVYTLLVGGPVVSQQSGAAAAAGGASGPGLPGFALFIVGIGGLPSLILYFVLKGQSGQ